MHLECQNIFFYQDPYTEVLLNNVSTLFSACFIPIHLCAEPLKSVSVGGEQRLTFQMHYDLFFFFQADQGACI